MMRKTVPIYVIVVCVSGLLVGCGKSIVTPSSAAQVPYLVSHLTVEEADRVLRTGMSYADVSDAIASIPAGGAHSTYFVLVDGHLVCRWENGTLKEWSLTKDPEVIQQEPH